MSDRGWVRDFIDEVFTMAMEIQDGFRQHVVEKGWTAEIHTDAIAPERSMAESLGWDPKGVAVQPEHRPAIDVEKFFRGTAEERSSVAEAERLQSQQQSYDRDR